MRKLKVYIVILTWNGLEDTLTCLDSLSHISLPNGVTTQTLVIDNGSDVDPCEAIHQRFAEVQTLRNTQNLGFAGGCNVGMRVAMAAGADAVLLLNNDTIVAPDFLAQLLSAQQALARPTLAAPLIYDMQQRNLVTFAGGKIDFGRGKFEHRIDIQTSGFLKKPDVSPQKTSEVLKTSEVSAHDYVTGCCMLIPRAVIERIGVLDASFFAYCEDVEYCLRARAQGIDCVLVASSHIWHNESASTRRGLSAGTHSPLKHYLLIRNQIWVIKKYAPRAAKLRYFGLHLPLRAAYYNIGFVLRGRWGKLRGFWRGVAHGFRAQPITNNL